MRYGVLRHYRHSFPRRADRVFLRIPSGIRQYGGRIRGSLFLVLPVAAFLPEVRRETAEADKRTRIFLFLEYQNKAVGGDKPLLHLDTHTNPECGVGIYIQLSLQDYFDQVQRTAEDEMRRITLKDILDRYQEKFSVPSEKPFEETL